MIRNFRYIVLGIMTACTSYVYSSNYTEIELESYNAIKIAVLAKKGSEYATQFEFLYPQPSPASVVALSQEFDEGSCIKWLESYPPQSTAYINGVAFPIRGAIANILYYAPYYTVITTSDILDLE